MFSQYSEKIAKNYADALFDLSLQRESMSSLAESFSFVLVRIKNDALFKRILGNPLLSKKDQENVISAIVRKEDIPFFTFIIRKKRFHLLGRIANNFVERVRRYEGRAIAFLETPCSLTQEQKIVLQQKLKKILGMKEILLEEQVNPKILGGIRLEVDGKILDASLSEKMKTILRGLHV